jgi:hypothetical protein
VILLKKISIPFVLISLTIVLSLFVCSCSKKIPLPKDKLDYIGVWVSTTQDTILIRGDGSGDCKVANIRVSGGVVRFEQVNTLIIEQFGIGPKMRIVSPPKKEIEKWTMNLDGIIYSRL